MPWCGELFLELPRPSTCFLGQTLGTHQYLYTILFIFCFLLALLLCFCSYPLYYPAPYYCTLVILSCTVQLNTVKGIGPSATCLACGTVIINCRVKEKTLQHWLMNTLYIPNAPNCLMSVKWLGMSDEWVTFYADHCVVKEKSGKVIAIEYESHMLYHIKPLTLMHNLYPSQANLKNIFWRSIMTDLWGPVVKSIGGYNYFILFMDDCTRMGQVLFLCEKSKAVKRVKDHCTKVEQ